MAISFPFEFVDLGVPVPFKILPNPDFPRETEPLCILGAVNGLLFPCINRRRVVDFSVFVADTKMPRRRARFQCPSSAATAATRSGSNKRNTPSQRTVFRACAA
jgi:hypothetical protein